MRIILMYVCLIKSAIFNKRFITIIGHLQKDTFCFIVLFMLHICMQAIQNPLQAGRNNLKFGWDQLLQRKSISQFRGKLLKCTCYGLKGTHFSAKVGWDKPLPSPNFRRACFKHICLTCLSKYLCARGRMLKAAYFQKVFWC